MVGGKKNILLTENIPSINVILKKDLENLLNPVKDAVCLKIYNSPLIASNFIWVISSMAYFKPSLPIPLSFAPP